jgi:outer membrane protein OmpA-like peptidoglycan-associated protein
MKRAILMGFAVAALVAAIGFGLTLLQRTHDLERQLERASRRGEMFEQQAQNTARDLGQALERISQAHETAEASARRAEEAAAARTSAESKSQVAEQAAKRAQDDAEQSRHALTELQQRREQELNRMQEALARIAATRRTASGMVIDLTNDSFSFDFDKSTLRPENREILSRIAGVLLASNGYRLFVHGHTDDVGSEEYNQQLSQRRAESVGSYLVSAGIDRSVIETRGFGMSSPRAAGKTSDARRQNRRVEIVVVDSVIHFRDEVSREEGSTARR